MLGRRSRFRNFTMRLLHVIHCNAKPLSRRDRLLPRPLSPANWSAICTNVYVIEHHEVPQCLVPFDSLVARAKAERRNVLSWLSVQYDSLGRLNVLFAYSETPAIPAQDSRIPSAVSMAVAVALTCGRNVTFYSCCSIPGPISGPTHGRKSYAEGLIEGIIRTSKSIGFVALEAKAFGTPFALRCLRILIIENVPLR